MSINIYLKPGIREFSGFTAESTNGSALYKNTLNGMHVLEDRGERLYLPWTDATPIPEYLKEFIEEISCYQNVRSVARREAGIYRHESAVCELMPEDNTYILKITATKMEDILEIIYRIKVGTITPSESYEGKQGGLSCKELEEVTVHRDQLLVELSSIKTENLRLTHELEINQFILRTQYTKQGEDMLNLTIVQSKIHSIRQLLNELLGNSATASIFRWPFVSKRVIVKKITAILDNVV
jgi:hypothetical protein